MKTPRADDPTERILDSEEKKTAGLVTPCHGALEHAGWCSDGGGQVVNGLPRGSCAFFKHAQKLKADDVWRMRVGFAGAVV